MSVYPSTSPTTACFDDPDFFLNGHKRLNCEWVAKKPSKVHKRCALVDKSTSRSAGSHCQGSCDPDCASKVPTESPTGNPTFAPSSESRCVNDDKFRLDGIKHKHCTWAARSPLKRCRMTDSVTGTKMNEACPEVCNLRCSCSNSKGVFILDNARRSCGIISRDECHIVSSNHQKTVADFCPRKCNNCYKEQISV
eukprot:CAMPEP_0201265320 /NCGR_PEP_ID=MMETSP0853-20130426/12325_1 /ASSEMBLY_ACC=CAM_ASM_000640 /TAXON_ID=183588 /ORGANISM="Pseudo-nitzschia fraudulenta, Strain WWA7" /LENGTH=194 /DNA_ID=CAMNT_0047569579 /DNA_START=185 /DNA_END=769 /DNA_ORIENTATION=+